MRYSIYIYIYIYIYREIFIIYTGHGKAAALCPGNYYSPRKLLFTQAMEKLRYEPLSVDVAGDSGALQSFQHSVLDRFSSTNYYKQV
jgi:hypothetical protein